MAGDDFEGSPVNHRSSDNNPIKVDRTIPLWGILTVLGMGALQAVMMWNAQSRQADAIEALIGQVATANASINRLTVEIGSKNIKDVEHDMALKDLERRLNNVESRPK